MDEQHFFGLGGVNRGLDLGAITATKGGDDKMWKPSQEWLGAAWHGSELARVIPGLPAWGFRISCGHQTRANCPVACQGKFTGPRRGPVGPEPGAEPFRLGSRCPQKIHPHNFLRTHLLFYSRGCCCGPLAPYGDSGPGKSPAKRECC
jgi:hypothetical protein